MHNFLIDVFEISCRTYRIILKNQNSFLYFGYLYFLYDNNNNFLSLLFYGSFPFINEIS